MTIQISSGLVEVYRRVSAFLDENGVDTNVVFGWKQRALADNVKRLPDSTSGSRVVIVPSDPTSGKAGAIDLKTSPGPREFFGADGKVAGHVRSLREWHRTFAVLIWCSDGADDEVQIVEKTEELFQWVIRAFHAVCARNVEWGEPQWTVAPKELTNGRELTLPGTLHTPVFDIPTLTARPSPVINREFRQPE